MDLSDVDILAAVGCLLAVKAKKTRVKRRGRFTAWAPFRSTSRR